MKKIWSYIAMFALGLAAGIVAGVKLMGDQVEVNIKRIKNKRVGSSSVEIPISVESPKTKRKSSSKRKSKRLDKGD